MKYLILNLSFLLLSFPAFAQNEMTELQKEKEHLVERMERNLQESKSYEHRIKIAQEEIESKKEELKKIAGYQEKFESKRQQALEEVSEVIKTLPIFQKIGKKAAFYKCLKTSLERGPIEKDKCQREHNPRLTDEEVSQLSTWKTQVGVDPIKVERLQSSIPQEIENLNERIKQDEEYLKSVKRTKGAIEKLTKQVDLKIEERNSLTKNSSFVKCDENTKAINLEDEVPYEGAEFKGPFYGIPKDNQDGIGSCFANTAKNLLIGLSDGKMNASFLDIALQYKSSNKTLLESGLNGGDSCSSLEALNETGFCPQSFSPLETGERNEIGENLFNLGPYEYMATNIGLIKSFVGDLDKFQKELKGVDREILSKSQSILNDLKENPKIQLPLPIVKNEVPGFWKLRESFYHGANKNGLSEKEFLKEYQDAYKKFYPLYLKSVLAKKGPDEIFEQFKVSMKPFIEKFDLEKNLPDFKENYKRLSRNDFNDPELRSKLRVSLDYLKKIMNKESLSDESFVEFCSNEGYEGLNFLGTLSPLVEKIRENKLNGDLLFDKNGEFKKAKELMQLAVAPSCLNEKNRQKLPGFVCDNGYPLITKIKNAKIPEEEKIKLFRENIVMSLTQGQPLGNSHPTDTGHHINTIVGMRFNKESKKCEYRIRESQTGTSDWHNEEKIFKKIEGLTRARKL